MAIVKTGKAHTTPLQQPGGKISNDGYGLLTATVVWKADESAALTAVGQRQTQCLEDRIPAKANVDCVGPYRATPFGFNAHRKGVFPADLAAEAEMPASSDTGELQAEFDRVMTYVRTLI